MNILRRPGATVFTKDNNYTEDAGINQLVQLNDIRKS